jgi:hypothetical protein
MKNSDIHIGHKNKEVRDFLSEQLIINGFQRNTNKKEIVPHQENTLEWSIKDAEKQIEYFQRYIQNLKNLQAIEQLISTNGWQEFDVSDYVDKDVEDGWMSFIGTEEEYNDLIKILKRKN